MSFFVRTLRLLGDALSFGLLYLVRRVVKRRTFQIDLDQDGQPDIYLEITHQCPGGEESRSDGKGRGMGDPDNSAKC